MENKRLDPYQPKSRSLVQVRGNTPHISLLSFQSWLFQETVESGWITCREEQRWCRYYKVPFAGALKAVVSMPVAATSEVNVSIKSK